MKQSILCLILILIKGISIKGQSLIDLSPYFAEGDSINATFDYSTRICLYKANKYALENRLVGTFYAGITPNFWVMSKQNFLHEEISLYPIPYPKVIFWDFKKKFFYIIENKDGSFVFCVPEQYQKIIQEYPLVKELKERLGLILG